MTDENAPIRQAKVAAEAVLILVVIAARLAGFPLPAWPFLLLIGVSFGVRPWQPRAERVPSSFAAGLDGWFGSGRWRVLALAAVAGVGYQFFTIFVEGPLLAIVFGEPETPPNVDGLVGNVAGLVGFLALVVVFAIGEELAFRGYLLWRLRHWFGNSFTGTASALILSSVAFGLMHTWQNLPGMTGTMISGAVFGAVFVLLSGFDVRAPIVTHIAVNVTAVFLAFFGLFIS